MYFQTLLQIDLLHLMIGSPPWMNNFVKSKIKWKNQLYKINTKNGYKCNDYLRLKEETVLVSQVIAKRKDYHNIIASKLK